VASELAFRLPLAHTAAFPALFQDLDAATTADTGISGYGVSVTTLEEVFLRIARSEEEELGGPTGKPQGNGERLGEAAGETSGSGQGPMEEGEAKERGQGGWPGPSLSKVRGGCERSLVQIETFQKSFSASELFAVFSPKFDLHTGCAGSWSVANDMEKGQRDTQGCFLPGLKASLWILLHLLDITSVYRTCCVRLVRAFTHYVRPWRALARQWP
jgi:hypothetical protein